MKLVRKNIRRYRTLMLVALLLFITSCEQKKTADFDTNPGADRDATVTETDTIPTDSIR